MMSPRAAAFTKAFTGILCTGLTYHLVFINDYDQHEGTNVFTPVSLSIARAHTGSKTQSLTPWFHAFVIACLARVELVLKRLSCHRSADGGRSSVIAFLASQMGNKTAAAAAQGDRTADSILHCK